MGLEYIWNYKVDSKTVAKRCVNLKGKPWFKILYSKKL